VGALPRQRSGICRRALGARNAIESARSLDGCHAGRARDRAPHGAAGRPGAPIVATRRAGSAGIREFAFYVAVRVPAVNIPRLGKAWDQQRPAAASTSCAIRSLHPQC
jgi:hypothetical protein